MREGAGPYRVERVEGPKGPSWRLVGPGLEDPKAYPWDEFREKLEELARLMNFAWDQHEKQQHSQRL
ncbi:MAG TPA: hypothetical protein VF669_18430 [Tepidisphaeraceae bacterium]|jgi:hypothetical protein